jgi:hypothetical protein
MRRTFPYFAIYIFSTKFGVLIIYLKFLDLEHITQHVDEGSLSLRILVIPREGGDPFTMWYRA